MYSHRNMESQKGRATSLATPKTKIDLKIVILGHGGVGKTSYINRYIHNQFKDTISTIGASFVLKKWKSFYFGIWDTAGQEKFTKISGYYCRGAQVAILAYDCTDRESFQAVDGYRQFLNNAESDCLLILLATKLDLAGDRGHENDHSDDDDTSIRNSCRQVSSQEGQEYAKLIGASFYETSAKEGINVSNVFDYIGYQCFAAKLADRCCDGGGSTLSLPAYHESDYHKSNALESKDSNRDRACCSIQ